MDEENNKAKLANKELDDAIAPFLHGAIISFFLMSLFMSGFILIAQSDLKGFIGLISSILGWGIEKMRARDTSNTTINTPYINGRRVGILISLVLLFAYLFILR